MGQKFAKETSSTRERSMTVGETPSGRSRRLSVHRHRDDFDLGSSSLRDDYSSCESEECTPNDPEPEPAVEEKEPDDCPQGSKGLDLVFVCDCTGSMGEYLHQAQTSIRDIVTQITASEKVDVRFALVEYRDHPPQERTFVKKVSPFTSSVSTMKKNVDKMAAVGGGDGPEAVVDGLHAALHLKYRKSAVKIVVVIADAPPHGLEPSGDSFPKGCPCKHDPLKIANQMAEAGITIYSVLCEPALGSYKFARDFFMAIAKKSGGQFLPLTSAGLLPKVIVASALEELSLQEVEKLFEKEAEELKKNGQLTEEALAERMKARVDEIETTTKQVKVTSIYTRQYSFTNVCKLERQTSLSSIRGQLAEHSEEVYDRSVTEQKVELDSSRMCSSQVSRLAKKAVQKNKY